MKTSAERQATYRQKRTNAAESGESRINTWITTGAALALGRLAKRYGVTRREMLERLILAAEQQTVQTFDMDSQEWLE